MKLLGIDYGTKRIGLAVADEETRTATPLTIVKNDDNALEEIVSACEERNVKTVVVGESTDFAGEDNEVMKHIRKFTDKLADSVEAEVDFAPEFMTSVQARRQPDAPDHVDGSAAAIILQRYLDK